jgi:hypothetical protein
MKGSSRRRLRSHRTGFVLITVVILLAVVALMLARLATVSLVQAREANRERQAMQSRWAVTSIRQLCENRAPALLVSEKTIAQPSRWTEDGTKLPSRTFQIDLNEVAWEIVLADESAKLNLPHLLLERPLVDVRHASASLLPKSGSVNIRQNIVVDDKRAISTPKQFEAWFELRGTQNEVDQWIRVGEHLTLWGDGRMNLKLASPESLDAIWRALFGRPAPIVLQESRVNPDGLNRVGLIKELGLRESEEAIFSRFFSFGGSATSVWIVPRMNAGRRESYFFVSWGGDLSGSSRLGFIY